MTGRVGQLIRYSATGGLAAAVDLCGFVLLERAGLGVGQAAALSFLVATIVNYLLTARFVFAQTPTTRGYGRFLLAALTGFGVNVGVTVLVLRLFCLPPVLSKAIGIGMAFFINFTLNALFVFRETGRPGGFH